MTTGYPRLACRRFRPSDSGARNRRFVRSVSCSAVRTSPIRPGDRGAFGRRARNLRSLRVDFILRLSRQSDRPDPVARQPRASGECVTVHLSRSISRLSCRVAQARLACRRFRPSDSGARNRRSVRSVSCSAVRTSPIRPGNRGAFGRHARKLRSSASISYFACRASPKRPDPAARQPRERRSEIPRQSMCSFTRQNSSFEREWRFPRFASISLTGDH